MLSVAGSLDMRRGPRTLLNADDRSSVGPTRLRPRRTISDEFPCNNFNVHKARQLVWGWFNIVLCSCTFLLADEQPFCCVRLGPSNCSALPGC